MAPQELVGFKPWRVRIQHGFTESTLEIERVGKEYTKDVVYSVKRVRVETIDEITTRQRNFTLPHDATEDDILIAALTALKE